MINQLRQRTGLRAIVGNAFIAALAVLAAGCDLSTGESSVNELNQFLHVRNPVGHVQGIVTDSNGRPLQNVLVTLGDRQTTTNSGGSYFFANVEVVNATGGNSNNDDRTSHDSLRIIISPNASSFAPGFESGPPANNTAIRHLGATVYVYPEAQFNNATGGGDNDATDLTIGGSQTVFVDGFRVQADDAVLPELNATIEILALRDDDTGQLIPAGTTVTLDFDEVDGNTSTEDDGSDVNYPTVSWSTTVQANGSVTFTNVAANSDFEMHVRGYSCAGSSSDNDSSSDTCNITSENETNVVTYANFGVTQIADSGDDVEPEVVSIVGAYDFNFPSVDNTECSNAGDRIAKLLRGKNGLAATGGFVFRTNEAIAAGATADSVVIYNYTTDTYVDVATVTVSGTTITVNTSTAVGAGNEISVYLFRPDFLDLAGNPIGESSVAEIDDVDCLGEISPVAGSGTSFLALDLEMFQEPNTDVTAVTPVQEEIDPVDSGANNDLPVNQAQSVAYNDVDDNDGGIQQLNADNSEFRLEGLELRADAFGAILGGESGGGNIDVRTARVEFTPSSGASGYRITRNSDPDTETVTPAAFDAADDTAASGVIDGDGDLRIQNVVRGTATLYALVVDDTEEGDIICVEALDDLGNAGDAGCVTVVDNVEPTVTIQRSYHADADFTGGVDDGSGLTSIETANSGDNVSGCYSHNNQHAGISLASGTTRFGEGGELTDPGSDQAVGNLCIGSSPELLLAPNGASDTAHTELEAGRDADFDSTLTGGTDRAYDGAAFTAWARPVIKMGAAFTEDLLTTPTPVETGVSAVLSGFAVQNNTINGHLTSPAVIQDLVSFDVNDAYVLANTDHFGTIDFTGVVDIAGNVATTAADAALTVRDQWPPYLVATTQRNADGTISFVFDTAVTIQDGDSIYLSDDASSAIITFTRDGNGDPLNFTQSVDGRTVTRNTDGLPELGGYAGLFADADLTYADPTAGTQHVIVDFSEIFDTRGNRWNQHPAIDEPLFIMPDALGDFTVLMTETSNNTALTFNLVLTATHAGYNWFDVLASVSPDVPTAEALFTGETGTNCTEATDGSVSCTAAFAMGRVTFTSTCDAPVFGTTSLNAAHTVMTIPVTCATTATTAGDTFTITFDGGSGADDGRFVSDFDGTTTTPAGTGVVYTGAATGTAVLTFN